ncbi:MAG TPA: SDR family NAD(P)-dependent oxidoreductase [bacterium]|nr:SDR family NAD(P)-dependent oxidoreductase [bacterium]
MKKYLVTGGAGFIGANLCRRLLSDGLDVMVLDNLSRPGAEENIEWLSADFDVTLSKVDIRDSEQVDDVVSSYMPETIVHLASQVAVTTSVADPRTDFDINARGTFNLLEAVRKTKYKPTFLFASTNKVYGASPSMRIDETDTSYIIRDPALGLSETASLDFHSPYGCSKGAADQYVRDYYRIYGIPTVVLRQSCIYGPRQFGIEDQGWVAWFAIASILGMPVTIYGDGKQARDLLFIDDLLDCYMRMMEMGNLVAGHVYNIGGGAENRLSIMELISMLESITGDKINAEKSDWRPGDQKIYVSDISKAATDTGWRPKTDVKTGVEKLVAWIKDNLNAIVGVLDGKA